MTSIVTAPPSFPTIVRAAVTQLPGPAAISFEIRGHDRSAGRPCSPSYHFRPSRGRNMVFRPRGTALRLILMTMRRIVAFCRTAASPRQWQTRKHQEPALGDPSRRCENYGNHFCGTTLSYLLLLEQSRNVPLHYEQPDSCALFLTQTNELTWAIKTKKLRLNPLGNGGPGSVRRRFAVCIHH